MVAVTITHEVLTGGIEMRRTVRTSISIPPALRTRMKAVEQPVNWSSVATRAFEAKLAEIEARKGIGDAKVAAVRLSAFFEDASKLWSEVKEMV
jgi:hypothetical protein